MPPEMPRELKTPREIRAEVHRLIHSIREVREDKSLVGVLPPTQLLGFDEDGCNWDMSYFGNASPYLGAIASLADVKKRWNLKV
jgi:hypothetical protein